MDIISSIKNFFKPQAQGKRGQIAGLSLIPGIVGALVIGFVFLSVGADVMQNIHDGQIIAS